MDELNVVLHQFQIDLKNFINDEVRRQVSAIVRDTPATPTPVVESKQRGPEKGTKAQAKPCPVTGVLNTHRRFSYLMPEARTPENLAKFKKGGAK
jgi:hypothetical protein